MQHIGEPRPQVQLSRRRLTRKTSGDGHRHQACAASAASLVKDSVDQCDVVEVRLQVSNKVKRLEKEISNQKTGLVKVMQGLLDNFDGKEAPKEYVELKVVEKFAKFKETLKEMALIKTKVEDYTVENLRANVEADTSTIDRHVEQRRELEKMLSTLRAVRDHDRTTKCNETRRSRTLAAKIIQPFQKGLLPDELSSWLLKVLNDGGTPTDLSELKFTESECFENTEDDLPADKLR